MLRFYPRGFAQQGAFAMTTKFDLAKAVADADPGTEGFAHALNLLVLAIRRTNPAVGPLLDEFTSMHADYLTALRDLPPQSDEQQRSLERFTQAARQIYKRLSGLDNEQSATLREFLPGAMASLRVH